jgi:hypothetical protein
MDIQQKLNEARKESADCQKVVDHYRGLHDALTLEDVEYDENVLHVLN